MKKQFIERVKKEIMVDTKNYRYVYEVDNKGERIKRIELSKLDTTDVYTDWEEIKLNK